jgi:FkbM family methyltransferase
MYGHDFTMPYSYQSSVGFQRQVGDTMAFEADYVYVGTRGMPRAVLINLSYDPATGANYPFNDLSRRPYPEWGFMKMFYNGSRSNQHALQTGFTRRFAGGWQASGNYTLSVMRDAGPGPRQRGSRGLPEPVPFPVAEDFGGDYVLSAGDQRHRAVLNGIWSLGYGFQVSGLYFYGSGERLETRYGVDLRGIGTSASASCECRLRPDGTIAPRNNLVGKPVHRLDLRLQQRIPTRRSRHAQCHRRDLQCVEPRKLRRLQHQRSGRELWPAGAEQPGSVCAAHAADGIPLRVLMTTRGAAGLPTYLRNWSNRWRPRQWFADQWRDARFYRTFVGRGELCFDIGANVGVKTRCFRMIGATVIAVEPVPAAVEILRARFGHDRGVAIVEAAIGSAPGRKPMYVGDSVALSTLSTDWLDHARRLPRLQNRTWADAIIVELQTLDQLVDRFGVPDFCKVDVEGYENQVLQGLSQPIPALCFEFQPSFITASAAAIDTLAKLGPYRFNYSWSRPLGLALADWVGADEMTRILAGLGDRSSSRWGDIYAVRDGHRLRAVKG